MINLIQKTAAILLGIAIAINLSGIILVAYAQDEAPTEKSGCNETDQSKCASTSFNVVKYLQAKDQKGTATNYAASIKGGLGSVIVQLINQLSYVIGSFALLALILGGFTYITSAGQERLITKAKDMIKYAIIGLVVAMSAFYITLYVQSIFYEIK
jgi:hypothetical protein